MKNKRSTGAVRAEEALTEGKLVVETGRPVGLVLNQGDEWEYHPGSWRVIYPGRILTNKVRKSGLGEAFIQIIEYYLGDSVEEEGTVTFYLAMVPDLKRVLELIAKV